jgi:uncharacterized protein (TIGR03435 family)
MNRSLQPHRSSISGLVLAAALVALAAPAALAQPPATPTAAAAQPLTFDVVTIKPHGQGAGWRLQPTPDGYTATNVSLLKLIGEAYGIFDPKLMTGGPPWIDKDKFDLEAKFDPSEIPNAKDLTYRQRADMLRAVLADRFHLKVHFESKDFPAYNLVIAKGGLKFQQTKQDTIDGKGIGITCTHLRGGAVEGCSMANLADSLRYPTGRTVIDKTGLTGLYDYPTLVYSTDNTPANSPAAAYPSIFTAVQEQLGLKLEPSTAPLDILVIDSAEPPTPN